MKTKIGWYVYGLYRYTYVRNVPLENAAWFETIKGPGFA
jgi:hypothetical protein